MARRPSPRRTTCTRIDSTRHAGTSEGHARPWLRAGFSTPVILTRAEFARSLDAFPVEFGEIIGSHSTVFGDDPFTGLTVAPADLRRACEAQVRSLLLVEA